jgi:tricorn protease
MFRESWRLMRDHFWTADMSGHDWNALWETYHPLVEQVGSRAELSDLVWAMQGSLGTSHAYEMGGDYRPHQRYKIGKLGATLRWSEAGGYEITHIINGEPGDPKRHSPLKAPGVGIRTGDRILSVDGVPTSQKQPMGALLIQLADKLTTLEIARDDAKPRTVVVRCLSDDNGLRYRDWVLENRARVHAETGGRIGYVHIPNMGPTGYAEFHRDYLSESHREGLIVDVRFNGGGHVSQLILEKLARRRVGYSVPRWGSARPYPAHSVLGPMVCLTNEMAGSDGDIFSHSWKLLELGPLVGTRTWGGVIGIWPRHQLVDKGVSTQPEFSYWFSDVKWEVENHGTTPDLEVDITPADFRHQRDPQLAKGIALATDRLDEVPQPDFANRPHLSR